MFSAKVDQRLQKIHHLPVLRSRDDKAYVRPGTSEGFEKVRNLKTLQLSDLERAKKLPKYDWPEKLMYVTPGSHRIMTRDSVISAEVWLQKLIIIFVSAVPKHSMEVLQQPGILKTQESDMSTHSVWRLIPAQYKDLQYKVKILGLSVLL